MEDPYKTVVHGSSAGAPVEGLRVVGRYRLLRELGRGAQGVVYLAEDINLHRNVALKMLAGVDTESVTVRERFQREAQLTSKFDHPGICGVHEVGAVDGVPYIAMQYVQGVTLAEILSRARSRTDSDSTADVDVSDSLALLRPSRGGGQQLHDLIKLIERSARALHVAHEAGLVHRDVKPGNIMVTPDGHPVLLDFGIARDLHAEGAGLTRSGQIIGTPAYLAPEQIAASRGEVDRRTDVYALGVILFECLTLRRPYDATSWDQLFHQILNAELPSPRSINPRIPQDLCTILDMAMERDPARRYPTAEAFADDLRRVRAFEPIHAKPAGRVARTIKWGRRNPSKATGVVAALTLGLVVGGLVSFQAFERRRSVRANLQRAESLLAAADFTGALEATAQAREHAPNSSEARELRLRIERELELDRIEKRRAADFELAAAARVEAAEHRDRHAQTSARIAALAEALAGEVTQLATTAASASLRRDFAADQDELRRLQIANEQELLAYNEALQRAARREAAWGDVSDETEAALAEHFMVRWRIARAAGDEARTAAMRAAAELHDRTRAYERELLGRGSLSISVAPPDAELHLFRYEELSSIRGSSSIPRWAPVPTAGVGRVEGAWIDVYPEEGECLVVRAVAEDSPAARAGLRVGDLVLRIQDQPCGGALFVMDLDLDGPLAEAGAPPLARVVQVDDLSVDGMLEMSIRVRIEAGAPAVLRVAGCENAIPCSSEQLRMLSAASAASAALDAPRALECLRDGELVQLSLSAGEASGLECEPTGNPLIFAAGNRVSPGVSFEVDPGSYLVVGRAPGRTLQRLPVLVERQEDVRATFQLPEPGDAPEGFVLVPAGAFRVGGDPEAHLPLPAGTLELPDFFIARNELTNREWYEFVNDPRTRARMEQLRPGAYLPRDDTILARLVAETDEYTWSVYNNTTADSPVLGLSWADVQDYLAWRNERAEADGEDWRYDLPSEAEWEKAARGVDGRRFPWGDRFDALLTICLVRSSEYLVDAPGGSEPRDESPYGVLDLAGSREEWLRDAVPESKPPRYYKRGGRWNTYIEAMFHSASRGEGSQDYAAAGQGFRLVLRKP